MIGFEGQYQGACRHGAGWELPSISKVSLLLALQESMLYAHTVKGTETIRDMAEESEEQDHT